MGWGNGTKCNPHIVKDGARGKHVRADVCHAFAHQLVTWGKRSDGRIYFESDPGTCGAAERISTIYSYGCHFPVATLWRRGKKTFATFTTRDYSASTSGHKREIAGALGHLPIFYIHRPDEPQGEESNARFAIELRLKKIADPKARTISGDIQEMRARAKSANAIARAFGFTWRVKAPALPKSTLARARKLDIIAAAREAKRRAKKQARDAEANRLRSLEVAEFLVEFRQRPKELFKRLSWYHRNSEHWTAADDAILAGLEADKVQAWRDNGGSARFEGTYLRLRRGIMPESGATLEELAKRGHYTTVKGLRVHTIETSKGANFPVAHGVKAWPFIKALRDGAREYKRNGHTIHLGGYAIDSIDSAGNVTAGCHVVPFAEIELMAKELGL